MIRAFIGYIFQFKLLLRNILDMFYLLHMDMKYLESVSEHAGF